jgi:chromosome segregation ATPase
MRQVIADRPGVGAIALRDDGWQRTRTIAGRLDKAPPAEKLMNSLPPWRAAFLLFTATVLAATSVSETKAESAGHRGSVRLAQATNGTPNASQGVPEQEQSRADALTRGLAATRRDIESVLTALRKAREEAAQIKGASENDDTELRNAHQERERADRLEQELAAARRDVETQTARAAKASEEVARNRQAAESASAELQKSLQQEHDKAEALTQEVSAVRTKLLAYEAQMRKAGEEAAGLKRAADDTTELRKSLSQERERAGRLEQDLASARRDVEKQTAQAAKASEEAARLKQVAEGGAGELRKSLQQERDKAEALTQEVSAARTRLLAYEAQARKAGEEAAGLKRAADDATELRKSLSQERERAGRLEQDLASARRDVEKQTTQAAKASEEAARQKQVAEGGTAELRKSLQQERDKAEALAKEVSAARSRVSAEAGKASEQAADLKKAVEDAAELRKSVQRERERAGQLEQALAAAQRDVETLTALAAKVREEATREKQVAETGSVDPEKSLQLERERGLRLERALTSVRSTKDVSAAPEEVTAQLAPDRQLGAPAARPVAGLGEPRGGVEGNRQDAAEVTRLMARANALLGQGDISSARFVLERAAETGSAQASFALAETYDPLVLPRWGTFGTRGDALKAQGLYAKAEAGGIKEAKERADALRR